MALSVGRVQNPTIVKRSIPTPAPPLRVSLPRIPARAAPTAPRPVPSMPPQPLRVASPAPAPRVQQPWVVATSGDRTVARNNRGSQQVMQTTPIQGTGFTAPRSSMSEFLGSLPPAWRLPLAPPTDPRALSSTVAPRGVTTEVRWQNRLLPQLRPRYDEYEMYERM